MKVDTEQTNIGAHAILISKDGDVLLQQRDNNPDIVNPGLISMFGGTLLRGESPRMGLMRELKEELELDIKELAVENVGTFFKTKELDGTDYKIHVFLIKDIDYLTLKLREGKLIYKTSLKDSLSNLKLTRITRLALQSLNKTPDILICFGKMLWNNIPDWFLESRLLKTIEIARLYPDIPIILTGGQSHLIESKVSVSEAEAMETFILNINPNLQERLIIEDKGDSTIHQIILIKTQIIEPKGYNKIGIITDEIHMPRAEATAKHILGDGYSILPYPSIIKLSGTYRKAIENVEEQNYKLLQETRLNVIQPGDHKEWQRVNDEYKSLSKDEKEKRLGVKL